jgi:hypothetical protein
MQRTSATAVGNSGQIEHLAKVVRCVVPVWNFEADICTTDFCRGGFRVIVQLILVEEDSGQLAGPVQFRVNTEGEMFEFLKEWYPLNSNLSTGPVSDGVILGISTWGFDDMTSRWYRYTFHRQEGI